MASLADNVAKVVKANADIKSAIADKGVDVPAAAKLSDLPALVGECGKKPLCTFEITFEDKTKCVETTSEGLVRLYYRFAYCAPITCMSASFVGCSSDPDAAYMFYRCTSLSSLTLPEGFGAEITNANNMFYSCTSLSSLTLPEGFGAKITNASSMFYNCASLSSLTLPDGFGAEITNASGMFTRCLRLSQIKGEGNILNLKVSFYLSPTILDEASLIRVLNSIQDVTSATTAPVLTLGTTLQGKLTSAEGIAALAAAKEKGWSIA